MMRRSVIATAYACEPGRGSEPGIGWNIVREVARYHDVTVITRRNNEAAISKALADEPVNGLRFVYYDPPPWATWWKKGTRGLFAYYYSWQLGAFRIARRMVRDEHFDLAHHVTFGRYWSPSFLYKLGIPVVWGPVGGGESAPAALIRTLPVKGRLYEYARSSLRWLGERDPFVRRLASTARVGIATTRETEIRLKRLGTSETVVIGNAALDQREIEEIASMSRRETGAPRFASVGRLLYWKGFHLGLQAFARAAIPGSEFYIIGDGPASEFLRDEVIRLGLQKSVRFTGALSRADTLETIVGCDALVHPSFHDSGGWVCIEAMSAGKPVIALDLGGPSLMVIPETGSAVTAGSTDTVVDDMAQAMKELVEPSIRKKKSDAAVARARNHFTWQQKGREIAHLYEQITGNTSKEVQQSAGSHVETVHI